MESKKFTSLCMAAVMSSAMLCGSPAVGSGNAADDEITVLIESGFESGEDGWMGRGSASVSVSKSSFNSGSSSLSVTKRAEAWNGATITLGTEFSAGSTYSFEAYVRFDSGSSEETFKLSLQYSDGTTTKYADIAKASVKKENGQSSPMKNTLSPQALQICSFI